MEDNKKLPLTVPYDLFYEAKNNCLVVRIKTKEFIDTKAFSALHLYYDSPTPAGYFDYNVKLNDVLNEKNAAALLNDLDGLPTGMFLQTAADQLIYISPHTTLYMGEKFINFCKQWPAEKSQFVIDAMKAAYGHISTDIRFDVDIEGGFWGSLQPGCSMARDSRVTFKTGTEQWYGVTFKNAETALQKYALLIGLAAMCTVYRESEAST